GRRLWSARLRLKLSLRQRERFDDVGELLRGVAVEGRHLRPLAAPGAELAVDRALLGAVIEHANLTERSTVQLRQFVAAVERLKPLVVRLAVVPAVRASRAVVARGNRHCCVL